MTIEFADPGYNWAFVWWPLGVLIGVILLLIFVGYAVDWDDDNIALDLMGVFLGISLVAMLTVPTLTGMTFYGSDVTRKQISGLSQLGFSNVEVADDRFTAATEDGKYFEGVLVDLRPESGYAYRVLELTETGE